MNAKQKRFMKAVQSVRDHFKDPVRAENAEPLGTVVDVDLSGDGVRVHINLSDLGQKAKALIRADQAT